MSQVPPPPPPPSAPGYPPQQPQPPYPGYASSQVATGQQANGLAIGSFICGLLGCFVITPLIGLILGFLGLKDAKKKGGSGRGMAIAGIVLSILWIGAAALMAGSIAAFLSGSKVERNLAAAFARDVAAGNVDAAMARATASVSREEVSAAADKLKPLGTVTDTTMVPIPGQPTTGPAFKMVGGAVTFNNGQGVGYAAKVVDQNGVSKIDGFTFTVSGATVSGGATVGPTPPAPKVPAPVVPAPDVPSPAPAPGQ